MSERNQPFSPRSKSDAENQGVFRQVIVGMGLLVAMVLILNWTSKANRELSAEFNLNANQAESQPALTSQPAEPMPTTAPPQNPLEVNLNINTLADRQPGWAKVKSQKQIDRPTTLHGRYQPDNEFTIETTNVERFQLDLNDLPVVADRQIIMHLDNQNMALNVRDQKVLYFGRTKQGEWFLENDPSP